MVTKKQIAALRCLIFRSKYGTDLSKRILALLIERSRGLRKSVCLSLVDSREGFSAKEISDAAHSISAMTSCDGTTHLDELTTLVGVNLNFSVHYGDFDPTRIGNPLDNTGQFPGVPESSVADPMLVREGMPLRYTFWLAEDWYSPKAELVRTDRNELEQIDLKKPGLYPELEY